MLISVLIVTQISGVGVGLIRNDNGLDNGLMGNTMDFKSAVQVHTRAFVEVYLQ